MATAPRKLLHVRFTTPLPITVNGGITTWRIYQECYGKNGGRLSVIAHCLDTGTQIVLSNGRKNATETGHRFGFYTKEGSTLYLIFRRLVRNGWAIVVEDEPFGGCADQPLGE